MKIDKRRGEILVSGTGMLEWYLVAGRCSPVFVVDVLRLEALRYVYAFWKCVRSSSFPRVPE